MLKYQQQTALPRFWVPAVILLVFLAWRLAVFTLAHPSYFHDDYEEIYRGTVAREIALGTSIPLWDYRVDNYAGGFYVVVSILPFFHYLFGFSMLGIKVFALVQTGLTWLVWYVVLASFVNRRTAILFSILYIFAPFRYITLSSLVFGDHAETCLLSALTVLLIFRMESFKPRERPFSYAALGVLGGFSLWFAYIYGVTILAALLYLLLNYGTSFLTKKNMAFALAGFAAGFSFWLIFNFHAGFSGFVIQGEPLWQLFKFENLWKPLFSWKEFFLVKLLNHPEAPSIWHPFHNLLLILYALFLGGAFLVVTGLLFKSRAEKNLSLRQSPIVFSLIYIGVFLLIQQMFDMVGLRFLLPFYIFMIVVVAYGLSEMMNLKPRIAISILAVLVLLASYSTVLRFDLLHAGEYLTRKGYSIQTLGNARTGVRPRIESVLLHQFDHLQRSDKEDYILAFVGQLELEDSTAAEEIAAEANKIPQNYRGYYAYLAGRELLLRTLDLVESVRLVEPLRVSHPVLFHQTLRGMFGVLMAIEKLDLDIEQVKKELPPDIVPKLAAFEGFRFAKINLENNPSIVFLEKKLDEEVRGFDKDRKERFLRGAGRFIFRLWSEDPIHSPIGPSEIEKMAEAMQRPIFTGVALQMLRRHVIYYSSPLIWNWNAFNSELSPKGREKMIVGIKYALKRWELPEEFLPLEALEGMGVHD